MARGREIQRSKANSDCDSNNDKIFKFTRVRWGERLGTNVSKVWEDPRGLRMSISDILILLACF